MAINKHLQGEESDHVPILLCLNSKENKANRPFRFFQAWISNPSCCTVVKKAWSSDHNRGMHCHRLNRSLNATSKALRKWNRESLGYAHQQIKGLENELANLQQIDQGVVRQDQIQSDLRIKRARMESINKQKSRELWLNEGNKNTKFFHLSTVIRRRRNRINAIKDGQKWLFEEHAIANYFETNFEELFSSDYSNHSPDIEDLISPCITEEENNFLSKIPLEEEIKESVWSLHPLKSPGSDGFFGIFYRKFWETIKEKVVRFVQECFKRGVIPSSANRMFLVLIPKVSQPTGFHQFRPISLCNFSYKVIANIIAVRLASLLGKLISLNQGAFVKGKWIPENTVIAQEIIHKLKK